MNEILAFGLGLAFMGYIAAIMDGYGRTKRAAKDKELQDKIRRYQKDNPLEEGYEYE